MEAMVMCRKRFFPFFGCVVLEQVWCRCIGWCVGREIVEESVRDRVFVVE